MATTIECTFLLFLLTSVFRYGAECITLQASRTQIFRIQEANLPVDEAIQVECQAWMGLDSRHAVGHELKWVDSNVNMWNSHHRPVRTKGPCEPTHEENSRKIMNEKPGPPNQSYMARIWEYTLQIVGNGARHKILIRLAMTTND